MMKTTIGSTRDAWRDASRRLMVAAACVLGMASVPLIAQAATLTLPAPGDRYCTAASNSQYGWFFHDVTANPDCANSSTCRFGVWAVSGLGSTCTTATAANLRMRLGGSDLPLIGAAEYVLNSSPPQLVVPLLEPALCEDYYAGGGGTGAWNLVIRDANDESLLAPVQGITTLNYILSGLDSGVMVANGNEDLRCYSGMAPNAAPPQDGPGSPANPDLLFIDDFEPPYVPPTGPNLQVAFLRADETPVADDLLIQGSGGAAEIEFTVRVTNIGNALAQDVRVREFVPTSSLLLMPTATRVACTYNGIPCPNANGNSNGIGPNPLRLSIGNLGPGNSADIVLRRHSNGSPGNDQPTALIQVAAFTASDDLDHADNSRSLRIQVVDQLQVTYAVSTDGTQGDPNGGTLSVTNTPTGCTTSGSTITCPPGTTGLAFSAIANSSGNYAFYRFTGCAGQISGTSFTSTSATVSCTLVADFRTRLTVTAAVQGGNGTVTPPSQTVDYNAQADVTVAPATGYAVDSVTGCGATQVEPTKWRTAPVTASCAITAKFKPLVSIVTATAGPNGAITSANPVTIEYPIQQAVFTVLPDQSFDPVVATSTTCVTVNGPSPNPFGPGVMYAANNVLGDCQIDFEFQLVTHPVTVANSNNGTLTLDNSPVPHGQYAQFTVAPNAGYHLDGAVTGTSVCGTIQVTGTSGTAGPIEADGCELTAQFAINEYTLTVQLATGEDGSRGLIGDIGASVGTMGPVMITNVAHGTVAKFATFPVGAYGPLINSSDINVCNFQFSLPDSDLQTGKFAYKASAVTGDCTIEVGFALSRPAGMSLGN